MDPPNSIIALLSPHLQASTDIKVKHGVIGLLKHIAQTPASRPVLGNGRILESLRTSDVLCQKSDIAEIVQMSAINLTKHMCTNNGTQEFSFGYYDYTLRTHSFSGELYCLCFGV